jgi:hypothetical protein
MDVQVLSKELLSAVQVVESEILSSPDPLPSATIKFFLKAGRSMGQGWVSVLHQLRAIVLLWRRRLCRGA